MAANFNPGSFYERTLVAIGNAIADFTDSVKHNLRYVLTASVMSVPVKLLWNHVLQDVATGLGELSYFQAFGLIYLARLLFGQTRVELIPQLTEAELAYLRETDQEEEEPGPKLRVVTEEDR